MRLVAPDLLPDLCGLSPGVVGLTAAVGAILWLFGWWSHRFWVVLTATVSAGVYGLFDAPLLKAQPLVASLLLALAAGLLALALIRLFAFVVGGLLGLALVEAVSPQLEQPLIVFLVCGLLGIILFRWCVTGVTSFAGSVLLVHVALVFLNQRGSMDAGQYAESSGMLLTGIVAAMTLVGFSVQLWHERRRCDKPEEAKPAKKKPKDEEPRTIFGFVRKAG